ncbi:MAG: 2Fe-2S iron-sulfur cluster-binding protein [Bacteriovoracaceae bacterium]
MLQKITLKGKASQRSYELEAHEGDLEKDLLSFLRSLSFPVASSCSGAGQCRKCVFYSGDFYSGDSETRQLLSCQVKVKQVLGEVIVFGYL